MILTIIGLVIAYIVVSLLIAYYKYTNVEYEFYPYTNVPKLHKGNINTCYGDVKKSLWAGFLLIPFWLLIIASVVALVSTAALIVLAIVGYFS